MNSYIISYDLIKPESSPDYTRLIEHIKSYQYWAKPLESFWFIKTSKTTSEVMSDLRLYTDGNDKIVVIEVKRNWTTLNLPKLVNDWMRNNIF